MRAHHGDLTGMHIQAQNNKREESRHHESSSLFAADKLATIFVGFKISMRKADLKLLPFIKLK
jgi:hypothetical protein